MAKQKREIKKEAISAAAKRKKKPRPTDVDLDNLTNLTKSLEDQQKSFEGRQKATMNISDEEKKKNRKKKTSINGSKKPMKEMNDVKIQVDQF